jgi:hypothetical protein
VIYLALTAAEPDVVLADGLADEVCPLTDALLAIDTPLSRSKLYHGLKRLQAAELPLVVAELTEPPKVKSVRAGAHGWLRERFG